ncbi:2621_t:CDS:2 [Paraglomus brasilianum]|uniref:2621_t:CDS:1 n=1 Tax=Paraglomus brasilianum TaxID=144538 RepID=A0A9N9AJH0_9GLOM|nr:2621_t:CDS:2 [Paraglomus brasilianum]
MVAKLAELVPIDPSRITTNRRNQPDPKAPAHQILLSVTFKSSDDRSQRTVQQIIDDLDDLVKNKGYNSFSLEYPTSCLDETYGFSPVANLWAAYKIKLIGLFAGLLVLLVIYFFARRKYPEGCNFIVIKFALILADLSLDVAFVLLSAKNVPEIHTPRMVWSECKNNFSNHSDVEAITFLGSKFAGLKMFSAPLSKTALNYVFWGSTLNLFIEDIPQLVIQVHEDIAVESE